ncbi:MAG: hypothetical protein DDT26_00296 [Dehalococcoidia bacterium]|nr:hypothetical protein [Chloroflexota bacterium]
MAWATGIATDHRDLIGKLRDFLTSNTALVALGQNWTRLSGPASGTPLVTDELVFSGPGLTGGADIRVGLKFFENAGAGFFNVGFIGLTTSGVNDIENQPNASRPHWMLLLNAPMTYWFVANGRRFEIIVRAGSNYQQAYCGFILPEHFPDDWPYPLYVGANSYERNIGNANATVINSAYWQGATSSGGGDGAPSCASICDPGRLFRSQANFWRTSSEADQSNDSGQVLTYPWSIRWFDSRVRQSLTDQPTLVRGALFSENTATGRVFYGAFDGLFYLPAFGVTAEQIITIGGVDHIAVPNTFRTGDSNFCAYALQ